MVNRKPGLLLIMREQKVKNNNSIANLPDRTWAIKAEWDVRPDDSHIRSSSIWVDDDDDSIGGANVSCSASRFSIKSLYRSSASCTRCSNVMHSFSASWARSVAMASSCLARSSSERISFSRLHTMRSSSLFSSPGSLFMSRKIRLISLVINCWYRSGRTCSSIC